jgi:hypothetical protein
LSRILGRHTFRDVLFDLQLEVGVNLFVQLMIGATAMDETAKDGA